VIFFGGVPGTKASNAAQDCAIAVLHLQDVVFPAGIFGIIGRLATAPSNSSVPRKVWRYPIRVPQDRIALTFLEFISGSGFRNGTVCLMDSVRRPRAVGSAGQERRRWRDV
jgi:hypothetical protein